MITRYFFLILLILPTFSFFKAHAQGLMISGGIGLKKQILAAFTDSTFEPTQKNRQGAAAYFFTTPLEMCSIRHRFEALYTMNKHYPDFKNWAFGWTPELLMPFSSLFYATLGAGPYVKTAKTPASGTLFAVNMVLGFGISCGPMALEAFLRHLSNAYTAKPNKGVDSYGLAIICTF